MPTAKPALWTKDFIIITLINFFIVLIFYLLIVIITEFAIKSFDASLSQAGLSASIFVIGSVIGRLLSGKWIEAVGRKRMLILGTFLGLGMSVLYFFISTLLVLDLVRLMHGIAYGLSSTATGTIVANIIPPSRRGEGIGYYMLSSTLATAIGPFLGLFLIHFGNYTAIFGVCLLSSLLSLINANIIRVPEIMLNQEQKAQMKGFSWQNFFEPNAMPISLICAIAYFCYSSVLAFLSIYAQEIDLVEASGLYFVVYSAIILVTRPFTGRLFDLKGENITMYPAFIACMLGMVFMAQAHQSITLLLSGAFLGFGIGVVQSCGQALAVKVTPAHRFGLAISTFFIFADIAIGIGPFLLGYLIPLTGYRGLFVVMALVAFSCIVLYTIYYGKRTSTHVSS